MGERNGLADTAAERGATDMPFDDEAAEAALVAAINELARLCRGDHRLRMTIPARPEHDSDVLIGAGIREGARALAEYRRLRAALAAAEPERGEGELAREIMRLLQIRLQPAGSPPPGDAYVLANWITASAAKRLEDAARETATLTERLARCKAERDALESVATEAVASIAAGERWSWGMPDERYVAHIAAHNVKRWQAQLATLRAAAGGEQ